MPDAQVNAAFTPVGENTAIPGALSRPAKANSTAGRGQFCTVDTADGMASLNDGATPGQISCGVADVAFISDSSSVAGNAVIRLTQRHGKGLPASTESGDSFTQADYCTPFFIADENTPGKLSNFSGSDRSFGGLVFGVDERSNPLLWAGPVASCLARSVHALEGCVGASFQIADASASAAIAETGAVRQPVHGVVTAIEFTGVASANHATNIRPDDCEQARWRRRRSCCAGAYLARRPVKRARSLPSRRQPSHSRLSPARSTCSKPTLSR